MPEIQEEQAPVPVPDPSDTPVSCLNHIQNIPDHSHPPACQGDYCESSSDRLFHTWSESLSLLSVLLHFVSLLLSLSLTLSLLFDVCQISFSVVEAEILTPFKSNLRRERCCPLAHLPYTHQWYITQYSFCLFQQTNGSTNKQTNKQT